MSKALVPALVSALLGACRPAASGFEGDYSDVIYSEETGDQTGVQLKIREHPTPSVFFEACEGACNGGAWFPASISGDKLNFTQRERWSSSNGTAGERLIRYLAIKEGDSLILTSPDVQELNAVVPRVKPALRR